jgi:hypothetical protein
MLLLRMVLLSLPFLGPSAIQALCLALPTVAPSAFPLLELLPEGRPLFGAQLAPVSSHHHVHMQDNHVDPNHAFVRALQWQAAAKNSHSHRPAPDSPWIDRRPGTAD